MTIDEASSNYILCDGQVTSCMVNFVNENSVVVILKVRQRKDENHVLLEFKFNNLIVFNLFEDFESENYSDITLLELEEGEYYLSLDPYGNSNEPNEKDNFIIRSKFLEIIERK